MTYYFTYLKRVLKHKMYATYACFKLGIYWKGLLHNLSAFRPDEFISSAKYHCYSKHYPHSARHNYAWLRHVRRNPHHWQYWVQPKIDKEGPTEMQALWIPLDTMKEMIADWWACYKAYPNALHPLKFWEGNREKIIMHGVMKTFLEDELKKLLAKIEG